MLRDGKLIGYATSGGMGWRCNKMLAVAWIDAVDIAPGRALEVRVLLHYYPAKIVADPVYDPKNERLLG